MNPFVHVIDSLNIVSEKGQIIEDTWAMLLISGNYQDHILADIQLLYKNIDDCGAGNVIKFFIDSEAVSREDIGLYTGKDGFQSWQLTLNKHALIDKTKSDQGNFNFFLTTKSCNEWFSKIDPFEEQSPIFVYQPLCIYINDLLELIGNKQLCFLPTENGTVESLPTNVALPDTEKLRETIHFISNKSIYLSPRSFTTNDTATSNDLMVSFLNHASTVFACCIVNEYYTNEKVVIDGIRRIPLTLCLKEDTTDFALYKRLSELVVWIYEDRATTRRKLFNDRLTLDINEGTSLLNNLNIFSDKALEQARGRYSFVITERKDAYVKELKDLLKDLRGQSDLYSQKIRTLLSNFLRDVLASIVLIGFTIFTKFSDNLSLDKHQLLVYVFGALGVYYLVSIVMQTTIDIIDIQITSGELRYWKKASSELLPEKEFDQHYTSSLKSRRRSLRWVYPIIALLYVGISVACFVYPRKFESLIITDKANSSRLKKNTTKQILKDKNQRP